MVILDLNHLVIVAFFSAIKNHTNTEFNEGNIIRLGLDMIGEVNKKFSKNYGDTVIACDSSRSWRREFFPYYKASRKKTRDLSEVEWPKIFKGIDCLKQDLKQYFPYRTIEIEGAEADDVIATISKNSKEKVLIVSADKDFLQLQYLPHISQYDYKHQRWLEEKNPELFLHNHILKGDSGDGIPNVLSADNCLVVGVRQTVLTEKRKAKLLEENFQVQETHKYHRNYIRNKTLIDFSMIPFELREKILKEFDSYEVRGNKVTMKKYFIENRMQQLFDRINDF